MININFYFCVENFDDFFVLIYEFMDFVFKYSLYLYSFVFKSYLGYYIGIFFKVICSIFLSILYGIFF